MSKPVNFYEVMSPQGDIEFGSASASEAVKWYRLRLGRSIFVSVWDEENEDFKLLQDRIEVTSLVLAGIASEKDRALNLVLR